MGSVVYEANKDIETAVESMREMLENNHKYTRQELIDFIKYQADSLEKVNNDLKNEGW